MSDEELLEYWMILRRKAQSRGAAKSDWLRNRSAKNFRGTKLKLASLLKPDWHFNTSRCKPIDVESFSTGMYMFRQAILRVSLNAI
jgi:hypothetical protein